MMRSIIAVVLMLIAVVAALAVVRAIVVRGAAVTQPIAFSHALHLGEAGLECLECHTDAQTRVSAGLPGKDICLDCHDIDEIE